MHEVIEQNNVKKLYRKAILITHPDRVHKSPTEQKFLANRIFGTLNEAWKVYDATGQ
jgi:DnaJ family protein C protein 6